MIRKSLPWLAAWLLTAACTIERHELELEEQTIAGLQALMTGGELTARELVEYYIGRIERLDRNGPMLNSIIELNEDALSIADSLDREREAQGPRGPLHGIPIVLKANIDTADTMSTTAGSLALEHHVAPEDAALVAKLRDAGAVIIGKANLSEWANFRSFGSTSGWSSIGGQTRNPYASERNPCGSSSGSAVAVAANLAVVAIGTETDGSIICPAGMNGVVGIKPTLGRVSRSGIIPIAHSQDTAGPMARTVEDAAILLMAISGRDPADPITADAPPVGDLTTGLDSATLAGKRIGVWRTYWGAEDETVREIFESNIDAMRREGVVIVDPVGIDRASVGAAQLASLTVMEYEFKTDLTRYLGQSGAPVGSLADVIAFNTENAARIMPYFGQELMEASEARGPLTDPEYLDALESSKRISRETLRAAFEGLELDALVAPSNGPAPVIDLASGDGGGTGIGSSSLAAISGYPSITVPAGFVEGLPVGLSFIGDEWGERDLIEIAYAFERSTRVRRPPALE